MVVSKTIAVSIWGSANAQDGNEDVVSERKPLIKGLIGSGAAEDPILIRTAQDLADLEREVVGLQGLYFKQTADIDISGFSTWPKISFCGHYDGGGFSVRSHEALFENINDSSIFDLNIDIIVGDSRAFKRTKNFGRDSNSSKFPIVLSIEARNSKIEYCSANGYLFWEATSCAISNCKIAGISDSLVKCTVFLCRLYERAVGVITESKISDCEILGFIDYDGVSRAITGAKYAAVYSASDSFFEKCFFCFEVGESLEGYKISIISGGFGKGDAIRCAVGGRGNELISFSLGSFSKKASLLENIRLDEIRSHDDTTKPISRAQFNQRYFDSVLEWDFDHVWSWDDDKNQPVLRNVGAGARFKEMQGAMLLDQAQESMLSQQLRGNIWI